MSFLAGAFPGISSNGKLWQLQNYVVYLDDETKTHIEVPSGFVYDLATIPKWCRSIVQKSDHRLYAPSAVHDFLYCKKGKVSGKKLSRKHCDRILRQSLVCNGVSSFKSWLIYLAVRLFGKF